MKKSCPLCKKINFQKNIKKLTSDSDSPPPITFGRTLSDHNRWVFMGLSHTQFWLAWADKLFTFQPPDLNGL